MNKKMNDLQNEIDTWFDKYKISKTGFFYKNASKLCREIIHDAPTAVKSRCGCTDVKNFITDGFKITCKIHHISWNVLEYRINKRITELETVLILIVGSLFYGDFKVETPNEKAWFQLLKILDMYPKNEDHYLELLDKYKKEN